MRELMLPRGVWPSPWVTWAHTPPTLPQQMIPVCACRRGEKIGSRSKCPARTSNKSIWLIEVLDYGTTVLLYFFMWGGGRTITIRQITPEHWKWRVSESKSIQLTNCVQETHWQQQSPHRGCPKGNRAWKGPSIQNTFLPSLSTTKQDIPTMEFCLR